MLSKRFFLIVLLLLVTSSLTGCSLINKVKERFFLKKVEQKVTPPAPAVKQTPPSETVDQKIAKWKKLLEKEPSNVGAHYSLGSAYREKGETVLALFEFQKVIGLSPKSKEAKEAKVLIKKDAETARQGWLKVMGKQAQEAVQIVQYTNLSAQLSPITQEATGAGVSPGSSGGPFASKGGAPPSSTSSVPTSGYQPITPVSQPVEKPGLKEFAKIKNLSGKAENYGYHLRGEVENSGSEFLSYVSLKASLYSSSKLVAIGRGYVNNIPAHESRPFSIIVTELGSSHISRHKVEVVTASGGE